MRTFIIMVLLAASTFSCSNKNESKVIYFIRHAEKEVSSTHNPTLSPDGVIRSVDLASWFKKITVDSIFSTDYARTMETIQPLAEEKGLEVSIYEAKEFQKFAKNLEEMEADTILVIGHSNTLLEQIEALGLQRPQPEIKEEEYDKIFEVKMGSNEVITHTYGSKFKD
jgi:phosphohistidine phosphatase SixA